MIGVASETHPMLFGDSPALLRRFVGDESGATAVEYALMGTFIAMAIVASASALGTRLSAIFSNTANAF